MEENEIRSKIEAFAEKLLFEEEKTNFEVRKILIEKGLDKEQAKAILDKINSETKEVEKNNSKHTTPIGILILLGGILASVYTENSTFIGAIVIGILLTIKGLTGSNEDLNI